MSMNIHVQYCDIMTFTVLHNRDHKVSQSVAFFMHCKTVTILLRIRVGGHFVISITKNHESHYVTVLDNPQRFSFRKDPTTGREFWKWQLKVYFLVKTLLCTFLICFYAFHLFSNFFFACLFNESMMKFHVSLRVFSLRTDTRPCQISFTFLVSWWMWRAKSWFQVSMIMLHH